MLCIITVFRANIFDAVNIFKVSAVRPYLKLRNLGLVALRSFPITSNPCSTVQPTKDAYKPSTFIIR